MVTSHKFQMTYVAKDRQTTSRRTNAAFRNINQLLLTCCHSDALQTRIIIRAQRNTVYQKSYNEQNYLFSKLMEIRETVGGKRRVTYAILPLEKVSRTAFRKCNGLSRNKIQVLLKKIHLDDPSVEPDQRGQRTPRKFLPLVKNMVINFICSYEASKSHYRKSRTNAKKYFDSKVSMRQMWTEFLKGNPDLKTTSLRWNNRGPVLSFSSFRNIFNSKLKDMLSFRKARQDTCQTCDNNSNKLKEQMKKSGQHRSEDEICRLRNQRQSHLRESEARFASLKYDITILATKVQRTG